MSDALLPSPDKPGRLQILHKQIKACRQCGQSFGFDPHPVVFGTGFPAPYPAGEARFCPAPSLSAQYQVVSGTP